MSTVKVSGLSPTTTKESLEKFLGFCGKVTDIQLQDKEATVSFEKPTSAQTAEFLNGGTLDGATLTITGPSGSGAHAPIAGAEVTEEHHDGDHVRQEDKPRSAIAAEYLAHGYVLGDHVIQQGITLDQKYGVSNRFLTFWNTKIQPTVQPHLERAATQARSVDEKQHVTEKASSIVGIGWDYYRKALETPYGQKVQAFYTKGAQNVLEVHEEAKRIAESKKASGAPPAAGAETPATAPTGDVPATVGGEAPAASTSA